MLIIREDIYVNIQFKIQMNAQSHDATLPTPTVHLNGNKTIYSVPEETTLYIKCRDSRNPTKFKDETVKISGMGEITFKSGCAIVLPGGQTFRTPSTYTGYQMENAKIYDLLRSHPIQTNITIKKMIEEEIPLTHLTIGEFQMPSWSEFAAETLHPIRSMPFITKFFICGLLMLIIVIIFKYLYKKNLLCCFKNDNMVNIPYVIPPENANICRIKNNDPRNRCSTHSHIQIRIKLHHPVSRRIHTMHNRHQTL